MNCPKCNKSYYTKKISAKKKNDTKYFCRECYIEFSISNKEIKTFSIMHNGETNIDSVMSI